MYNGGIKDQISTDQQRDQHQQDAIVNNPETKYSPNEFSFKLLCLKRPFAFVREQ